MTVSAVALGRRPPYLSLEKKEEEEKEEERK
jgi:hypothetical protein